MHPNPFIHTTTTGGWALACSAAIAAIHVALRDDYPKQAEEKGEYTMKHLEKLVEKYPEIYESVSGKWLLIAQHFHSAEIGYQVTAELFKNGVLIAGTLNSALTSRIEPPIVITYEEIDRGIKALEQSLETVSKNLIIIFTKNPYVYQQSFSLISVSDENCLRISKGEVR